MVAEDCSALWEMLLNSVSQGIEKQTIHLWNRSNTAQQRRCWVSKHGSELLRWTEENWQRKQSRECDEALENSGSWPVKCGINQGQYQGHLLGISQRENFGHSSADGKGPAWCMNTPLL